MSEFNRVPERRPEIFRFKNYLTRLHFGSPYKVNRTSLFSFGVPRGQIAPPFQRNPDTILVSLTVDSELASHMSMCPSCKLYYGKLAAHLSTFSPYYHVPVFLFASSFEMHYPVYCFARSPIPLKKRAVEDADSNYYPSTRTLLTR